MKPQLMRGAVCLAGLWMLVACSADHSAAAKEVSAGYLQTLLVDQQLDDWSAFFQPGARLNGSDLGQRVMAGYANGLNNAFADMSLVALEKIAADSRVVTHFVIKGSHQRAFNMLPPTGRAIELQGIAIDRFERGLIANSRLMLDTSRLNSALLGVSGAAD